MWLPSNPLYDGYSRTPDCSLGVSFTHPLQQPLVPHDLGGLALPAHRSLHGGASGISPWRSTLRVGYTSRVYRRVVGIDGQLVHTVLGKQPVPQILCGAGRWGYECVKGSSARVGAAGVAVLQF